MLLMREKEKSIYENEVMWDMNNEWMSLARNQANNFQRVNRNSGLKQLDIEAYTRY